MSHANARLMPAVRLLAERIKVGPTRAAAGAAAEAPRLAAQVIGNRVSPARARPHDIQRRSLLGHAPCRTGG